MFVFKRARAFAAVLILLAGLTACTAADSEPAPQPTVSGEDHTCSAVDPYQGMSKESFYADYEPACCNQDAAHRSKHGFLSGVLEVPGQFAQEAQNRPRADGKFVRNTAALYLDSGNTYVVTDSQGNEVLRVHRAGGYITLEEVAAYMYAFGGADGSLPANYTTKKKAKPDSKQWGLIDLTSLLILQKMQKLLTIKT